MCGKMGRMCGITGMSACGFRNSKGVGVERAPGPSRVVAEKVEP